MKFHFRGRDMYDRNDSGFKCEYKIMEAYEVLTNLLVALDREHELPTLNEFRMIYLEEAHSVH